MNIEIGKWVLCNTENPRFWGLPRKVSRISESGKCVYTDYPQRNASGEITSWKTNRFSTRDIEFVSDTEEAAMEVHDAIKNIAKMFLAEEKIEMDALNELHVQARKRLNARWEELYTPIKELMAKNRAQS